MSDIDPEKLEQVISAAEVVAYGPRCTNRLVPVEMLQELIEASRVTLNTLPRFKEAEVWGCRWMTRSPGGDFFHATVFEHEGEAIHHRDFLLAGGNNSGVEIHGVTVTGPHKQRVPA